MSDQRERLMSDTVCFVGLCIVAGILKLLQLIWPVVRAVINFFKNPVVWIVILSVGGMAFTIFMVIKIDDWVYKRQIKRFKEKFSSR